MKKNKTMRLASVLLVLVLLSTCVISGTFAKYVTSNSGSDSARVAKWGVELYVSSGEGFQGDYLTHDDDNYDGVFSVLTSGEAVVAPGTSSEDVEGDVTFSITGFPEVATKVDIALENIKDVFLGPGTYKDYTKVTGYDTNGNPTYDDTLVINGEGYYPVKWTLEQTTPTAQTFVNGGKLSDVKDFLDTYTADEAKSSYDPNQSINATFKLSWAWDYGTDSGISANDKADTLLGNLAAGEPVPEGMTKGTNYSTEIAYNLDVTVTQVD